MNKFCHVPRCEGELASPEHLMCLEHWARVSPATQAAVWASYHAVRKYGDLRAIRNHRANVEQAVREAMA